ncbi:Homeodomain-like protein, partial [Mycotypha africana]|uniref:Homeodomain-like protein n=1 Tax=Mycotypha africana TaxID=64632 RepID=UPI002300654C
KRKRILPHQYKRLLETFEVTDTPSSEIRSQLAAELDMTKREVQVWFQNRRAKMNRCRQQGQMANGKS